MSCKALIYDDCCLLTDINLNSERVYHLLERRFKNNSTKTSFDFKCFPPEQPSNNAKVSRSLLRCQPKNIPNNQYDDNNSSDAASLSSENDDEEVSSTTNDDDNDDDRLNKLAEWEPENSQRMAETDDDDEEDDDENENIFQSVSTENNDEDNATTSMDVSSAEETSTNPTEDLLVTYIHQPIKTEPISYDDDDDVFDNPPQLDGQIDLLPGKSDPNQEKKLVEAIAKVTAKQSTPSKTIQLHVIPIQKSKFTLKDDDKTKPKNQTPKRSTSKINPPKEKPKKELKPTKKAKPPLLSSLLKTNEVIIRPLQTSISTNNQKTSRLSSESHLSTANPKVQMQKKSLSIDERITPHQQIKTSLIHNKQISLPRNPQALVKSKEKSASDHMTIAEKKLNHYQKHQQSKPTSSTSLSTKPKPKENIKNPSKLSKPKDPDIRKAKSTLKIPPSNKQLVQKKTKKLKRLDNQQPTNQPRTKLKKQDSMDDFITKKPPSIKPTNSDKTLKKRPANFFEGCITIDDDDEINTNSDDQDDIQEIERQPYSIAYNIRSREKLLDHIVHSSAMHVKWLFNLDYVLLEHISICHENNIRPLNDKSLSIKNEYPLKSSIYQINPSFISTIIINFLKLFILQNSSNDQQNVSFIQFGLISHLRYLLIELPTYNHSEEKDLSDYCSKCHQYSLIINILFDLLFDLIEYDLCEITSKMKYRSSLIEDDYFGRFSQRKIPHKNSFDRIKFLIYFIELIGIHMNKCSNKKQFQFNKNENKFFHSIEDFIRHIFSHLNNSINQRISICFNVMELCLLFVNEKESRIKQMGLFLAELYEHHSDYFNLFLFEKNLFPDIRLLLINELISKKFNNKLRSIEHIQQLFDRFQENFNSINSIDEYELLLFRSLFNTYADLILELKGYSLAYSTFIQDLRLLLHNQLKLIFDKLIGVSYKGPEYFQKIKSTLFFYRLLKCKWNKL